MNYVSQKRALVGHDDPAGAAVCRSRHNTNLRLLHCMQSQLTTIQQLTPSLQISVTDIFKKQFSILARRKNMDSFELLR